MKLAISLHFYFIGGNEPTSSLHQGDAMRLEQAADAGSQAGNHPVLASDDSPRSGTASTGWKPYSRARRIDLPTSAEARTVLVGIQPQLRQTPPRKLSSTTATFAPNWAARTAP